MANERHPHRRDAMRVLTLEIVEQLPMDLFTGKDVFNMIPFMGGDRRTRTTRHYTIKQISQCLNYLSRSGELEQVGHSGYGTGARIVLYARSKERQPTYTEASEQYFLEVLMADA